MPNDYTQIKLTDVNDSAPEFGYAEVQEARFAKDDLDAQDTGISHHRLKAGRRQPFAHKHEEAEEVYVILDGSGKLNLDGEILEVSKLDAIRIAPGVTRALEAGPEGIEVLAVGRRHDGDGELIQDWWAE